MNTPDRCGRRKKSIRIIEGGKDSIALGCGERPGGGLLEVFKEKKKNTIFNEKKRKERRGSAG